MNTALVKLRLSVAPVLTFTSFYAFSAADPSSTTLTNATVLNLPDMAVWPDTPIGAKIGTAVFTPPLNAFSCTEDWNFQELFVKGTGAAAAPINCNNIYKLNSAQTRQESATPYTVKAAAWTSLR